MENQRLGNSLRTTQQESVVAIYISNASRAYFTRSEIEIWRHNSIDAAQAPK
jgi:hypothetical protein